jgi:hypothetical protein
MCFDHRSQWKCISDNFRCGVSLTKYKEQVRFQVLTATNLQMTVFWDVALCCVVEIDRRFEGVYCLHHQGDGGGSKLFWNVGQFLLDVYGAASQKTVIL